MAKDLMGGKPWGWWAKLQLRDQKGDDAGQWIEMGGLGLIKFRANGNVVSAFSRFIGPSDVVPGGGKFLVTGDPNIPDGIYHLSTEFVDSGVKARLSDKLLRKMGYDLSKLPYDPNTVVDLKSAIRTDASAEDIENSNRRLPELKSPSKRAGKREKTETTYGTLQAGDIVYDESSDLYGEVLDAVDDATGDLNPWVRWETGQISQIGKKNPQDKVFAWREKTAENGQSTAPGVNRMSSAGGRKPVSELRAGDKFTEDGVTYTVKKVKAAKGKPGPDGEKNIEEYSVQVSNDATKQDDEFVFPPDGEVLEVAKSAKPTKKEGETQGTTGRYASDKDIDTGSVVVGSDGTEYIVAYKQKKGNDWELFLQDPAGNLVPLLVKHGTMINALASIVTKKNKNGNLSTSTSVVNRKDQVKHKAPAAPVAPANATKPSDPTKASDKDLIDRHKKLTAAQEKLQKQVSDLSKRSGLSPKDQETLGKMRSDLDKMAAESIAIEDELANRGYELNANDEFVKPVESNVGKPKGEIFENFFYEILPSGEMAFYGPKNQTMWNNRHLIYEAAKKFAALGLGRYQKPNYRGKENYHPELNKAAVIVPLDPIQGTVEEAHEFIKQEIARLHAQENMEIVDEDGTFTGNAGTRGDLGSGVSFEIDPTGKITFSGAVGTDQAKAVFDWLMFDSDGEVADNDTEKGDDGSYRTFVFSNESADRAAILNKVKEKLAGAQAAEATPSKPEVGTKEYWDWVAKQHSENKLSAADFKEAVTALFDQAFGRISSGTDDKVKSVLDAFFGENPDAVKSQALEAFKSSDLFQTIGKIEDLFKKLFGDDVVNKPAYKKAKKDYTAKAEKALEDSFEKQIGSYVKEVGEKPAFEPGSDSDNSAYWKWAKQSIDAGTLSDDDKIELYTNLRSTASDAILIDVISKIEDFLRDLLEKDPKTTRDEARKALRSEFATAARDYLMRDAVVSFLGKDFVGTKEYKDLIRATQGDVRLIVEEQFKEVVNQFIPVRRATGTKASEEVSASDLQIGDEIYLPGSDRKETGTIVAVQSSPGRRLITVEKEDGSVVAFDVKSSTKIDKILPAKSKEEAAAPEAPAAPAAPAPAPAPKPAAKVPSKPRPVSGLEELDLTGLSDQEKRDLLELLIAHENLQKARAKLPAGEFDGWGEEYAPTYTISEADRAWFENEENAEILAKLRTSMDELGIPLEERENVLALIRQLPYAQARQFVLNFTVANPPIDTEFGKRAESIKDAIDNFKALLESEKISVPESLKDIVSSIPAGLRTDYSFLQSDDEEFAEYLKAKYPEIDPEKLFNLKKHEGLRKKERALFDAWLDANKKRVFDQVFQMGDIQIRYKSDGKMTKRSFAVLANVLKVISDQFPMGGAPTRVTIADKDWMKAVTGSENARSFTTFDEGGANIILSESLFGPRKPSDSDGLDPLISEVLKQYGVAFYGGVVGAGFDRAEAKSELERIFRNRFDVPEGSSGVIEFSNMFRDHLGQWLNGEDVKGEIFHSFLVQAVNSGYLPTTNVSDKANLDGNESPNNAGAAPQKSSSSNPGMVVAGAKELVGEARRKLEETEGKFGSETVRWLSGTDIPGFNGVSGVIPDPVDAGSAATSTAFESFITRIEDSEDSKDFFRYRTTGEITPRLEAAIRLFNKLAEQQRKDAKSYRVLKVDGTNTYIRWRDDDYESPAKAKEALQDIVATAKQLYLEDALNDFPRYITLTKKGRFAPGMQYFDSDIENWTGYSTITNNGAYIVLDVDSNKLPATYRGQKNILNHAAKNKQQSDLVHEDGHLTLQLRSNDHKNQAVMQSLQSLNVPAVSKYGRKSLIEHFAELRRALYYYSKMGRPIPDELLPAWQFFKDLVRSPIDPQFRNAAKPNRMESEASDLSSPDFPETTSISAPFNTLYDEYRARESYYRNGMSPSGTRDERISSAILPMYDMAKAREQEFLDNRTEETKKSFEDAVLSLKELYDAWYWLISKGRPSNTVAAVTSRLSVDESRFRQWTSGKTDPETGKGVFKNKESIAEYRDQNGNLYTIVFSEAGPASQFLSKFFDRKKQTRIFAAAFTGDLSPEDMKEIDSRGLENYRSTESLYKRAVSTLLVKDGVIEMVETAPRHQRRGLATALKTFAQQEYGQEIDHSQSRTPAGDVWATSIDGVDSIHENDEYVGTAIEDFNSPSINRMASEGVGDIYTELVHPNLKDFISSDPRAGLGPNNSVVGEVSTQVLSDMAGNELDEDNVLRKIDELRSGQGFRTPVIVSYNPSTNTAYTADGNHRVEAARRLGLEFVPTRVITDYNTFEQSKPVNNGFGETNADNPFAGTYFPRDIHPAFVFGQDDILGGDLKDVAPSVNRMLSNLGVWSGDLEGVDEKFLPDQDENLYETLHPGKYVRIKSTGEIARISGHNLDTRRDDETQKQVVVNLGGIRVMVLQGIRDAMDVVPVNELSDADFGEQKRRTVYRGNEQPETIQVGGETSPGANDYRVYEERLLDLTDLEDVTDSFMKVSDNPVLLFDSMYLVQRETGRKGRINRFLEPGKVEIAELTGYDSEGAPIYVTFTSAVEDLNPIQEQLPTPPGEKPRSFFRTKLAINKSLVDKVNSLAARLFAFGYMSEQQYRAVVGAARGKFLTKSGAMSLISDLEVFDAMRGMKAENNWNTPLSSGKSGRKGATIPAAEESDKSSNLPINQSLTARQNESFHRRVNSGNFPGMLTDQEIKSLNDQFMSLTKDTFSPVVKMLNMKELLWGMDNNKDISELVDKYYRDVDGNLALPSRELASRVERYLSGEKEPEVVPEPVEPSEPSEPSEPEKVEEVSVPEEPAAPAAEEVAPKPSAPSGFDFNDLIDFTDIVKGRNEGPGVNKMAAMPVITSDRTNNSPTVSSINEIEDAIAEDGVVSKEEAVKIIDSLSTIDRGSADALADKLQTARLNKRLLKDESIDGLRIPDGYNVSKLENYAPAQPSVNRVESKPEVKLGEEQQAVLDHLLNTTSPFFLTGEAGSGKTTLIKEFVSVLNEAGVGVAITAPTGIAALNAGGKTIHSMFAINPQIPVVSLDINEWLSSISEKKKKLLSAANVIIVDEISMVRADMVDFLDRALRAFHNKFDKPFGGIQIVMVGDPLQLPPVLQEGTAESRIVSSRYVTPNFFEAAVFKEFPLEGFRLSKIYRQSEDSDPEFVAALRRLQVGETTQADINYFNSLAKENDNRAPAKDSEGIIHLTPNKAGASRYNEFKLSELKTELVSHEGKFSSSKDTLERKRMEKLISDGLFPKQNLELKEGAQVMFLKNDTEGRWVNGTIGIVEKIDVKDRNPDGSVSKFDLKVRVGDQVYDVTPTNFELTSQEGVTRANDAGGLVNGIETVTEGIYTQFPLTLAWATTIHKAQGLSLDSAVVDLEILPDASGEETSGRAQVFAPGQLYVAMSRIRSSDGLYFTKPISLKDVKVDPRVIQFIRSMFGRNIDPSPSSVNRMASYTNDERSTQDFASGDVFDKYASKDESGYSISDTDGMEDFEEQIIDQSIKDSSWIGLEWGSIPGKAATADILSTSIIEKMTLDGAYKAVVSLIEQADGVFEHGSLPGLYTNILGMLDSHYVEDTDAVMAFTNPSKDSTSVIKRASLLDEYYHNQNPIPEGMSEADAANKALKEIGSLVNKLRDYALEHGETGFYIGSSRRGDVRDGLMGLAENDGEVAAAHFIADSTFSLMSEALLAMGSGKFFVNDGTNEAKDRAKRLLVEQATSEMVSNWAASSNDDHAMSLLVQDQVAEMFNLVDTYGWKTSSRYPGERMNATEENASGMQFIREFISSQYEATQNRLKDLGVSSITVWRGQKVKASDLYNGIPESARMRPLSSWSISQGMADLFSNHDVPSMRDEFANGSIRSVLGTTVPASRIFGMPGSGFGCLGESEVVVLGGLTDLESVNMDTTVKNGETMVGILMRYQLIDSFRDYLRKYLQDTDVNPLEEGSFKANLNDYVNNYQYFVSIGADRSVAMDAARLLAEWDALPDDMVEMYKKAKKISDQAESDLQKLFRKIAGEE